MLNDARVSWTEQCMSIELKTVLYCLCTRIQDSTDYFILHRYIHSLTYANFGVLCKYNMQVSLKLKMKGIFIIYQSFHVVSMDLQMKLYHPSIQKYIWSTVKTNVKYYICFNYLVILKVHKYRNNLHGLCCKFRDTIHTEKTLKNHGTFIHLINNINS